MHPVTAEMYARAVDADRARRAAAMRDARRIAATRRTAHRAALSCWSRRRLARGLELLGAPRVPRRLASC